MELIATIATLSVLAAIAVPSFRTTTLDNRRAASVNEFLSGLAFARSEALNRRTEVMLCRVADAAAPAASTTCGTGTGYESGWIIFVDANGNDRPDTDDDILRRGEKLGSGITLRGNTNVLNGIAFNSLGTTGTYGALNTNGTLVYCDQRGFSTSKADARIITVAVGGRVRNFAPNNPPPGFTSMPTGCSP